MVWNTRLMRSQRVTAPEHHRRVILSFSLSFSLSLPVLFSFSLAPRRSSPAALIVFLIQTRWDGIMYIANYSDTSATHDTPPPQTRHPDFIIVVVFPVILISLFSLDAPLNLFACKFVRPFLSRTSFRRRSPVKMQTLLGIAAITRI